MPTDSQHSQALLGETLLAQLRLAGFTVTEEHYVRLFSLLDRLEGQCHLQDLRTLLCPLFATNCDEQESFYKVFDQWYPHATAAIVDLADDKPPSSDTTPDGPSLHPPPNRTAYLAVAIVIAIALTGILWVLWPEPSPQPITPSDNNSHQDFGSSTRSPAPQEAGQLPPSPDNKAETMPTPPRTPSPAPEPLPPPPNLLTQLRNQTFSLPLLQIYAIVLVALLCLMASLALRWRYKRQRRRWTLEVLSRERQLQPPFSWPLQVETKIQDIFNVEDYRTAARELRKPYRSNLYRLDIPATISATITSVGYPELRYKADNQSPEYLVLIDRVSNRDHQAQAYVQLTKFLERHGVYLSRWLYESDPRACWDEQFASPFSLEELAARYSQSRLLLFGDGARLQDASTGELYPWTNIFMNWNDRAILTPRTPEAWGDPEFLLASSFVVLPATSHGLLALTEQYESAGISTLRSIDNRNPIPSLFFSPLETDPETTDAIHELKDYLGKEGFRWICACALHSELHWDVTLRLASLPEIGVNLLTEQRLLRLIRLPWFRTGKLPHALRKKLVESGDPVVMHAACQSLITILERNRPPRGTFALDRHEISLAFQRWLIENSPENRKSLKGCLGLVKLPPFFGQVVKPRLW